jgi:hypothetical protein
VDVSGAFIVPPFPCRRILFPANLQRLRPTES